MKKFIIQPNEYLERSIEAFYHADYFKKDRERIHTTGTVENVICMLKNSFGKTSPSVLQKATENLSEFLRTDLPKILKETRKDTLTVCVIPRAKAEWTYDYDQLYFKDTVRHVVNSLNNFADGTDYIIRHTNTLTTHLKNSGYGGDGRPPYQGITKETCTISDEVRGKDILLIDDLYTKSVNIDEDAIQALLDKGAKSVVFYSIGKTICNKNFVNLQSNHPITIRKATYENFVNLQSSPTINNSINDLPF